MQTEDRWPEALVAGDGDVTFCPTRNYAWRKCPCTGSSMRFTTIRQQQNNSFTQRDDVRRYRVTYVFFTEKTWKALGVPIEDFPGGQASVEINGTRVLGHVSHNHFADIDVLGASFLKQRQLVADYINEIAEIK